MKKVLKFLGGVFYYSTSILIALIITFGLWAGFAYYSYNTYYHEYVSVSNKWIKIDNAYLEDINLLEAKYNELSEAIKEYEWADEKEKQKTETDMAFALEIIKEAEFSMSYDEKFASYPELGVARTRLQNVAKTLGKNDIYNQLSSLNLMNIDSLVKEYNDSVKAWNAKMDTFPLNYIAKVTRFGHYKTFKP